MHVVDKKARAERRERPLAAIFRDSKAVRSRLLLCAGGGGCSSCGVFLRHLEVHSVAHEGMPWPEKALTAAGAREHVKGEARCGKGKLTRGRRQKPPSRYCPILLSRPRRSRPTTASSSPLPGPGPRCRSPCASSVAWPRAARSRRAAPPDLWILQLARLIWIYKLRLHYIYKLRSKL